ncbi:hypothetical protein A4W93_13410 [Piscinibacter gummiphilus]|uniref:Uncharacterized protein n=1 Tax=Piscinibacter gummiphilus TaxID=946333 RepID=A0A1W6L9D6_9BURK|nr:hypothetical protein A4W93_13410 [Piscinibacter gummiphilus]
MLVDQRDGGHGSPELLLEQLHDRIERGFGVGVEDSQFTQDLQPSGLIGSGEGGWQHEARL